MTITTGGKLGHCFFTATTVLCSLTWSPEATTPVTAIAGVDYKIKCAINFPRVKDDSIASRFLGLPDDAEKERILGEVEASTPAKSRAESRLLNAWERD